MSHTLLGTSPLARATLVLAIACLYAGAALVNNNLLFPWLEFDNFRNLLFLPAGLKLFLVMLFGWAAVAGIALGIAAVALSEFTLLPIGYALLLGAAAALSTQLSLTVMARALKIAYPWSDLHWIKLCVLATVVGCVDALTVQLSLSALGLDTTEHMLDEILQAAFGRVAGTFVFLALSLHIRRQWLVEQHKR